jgi:hypothetical protein
MSNDRLSSLFIVHCSLLIVLATASVATAAPLQVRYDSEHFGVIFPSSKMAVVLPFARRLEGLRTRVVQQLGFDVTEKVIVRLAPDRQAYEALIGEPRPPKWSVGLARPDLKTIVMFTPDATLRDGPTGNEATVFMHELTHVYLYCRLGNRRAPRWLDEGVARMVAGEWNSFDAARLTLALLFDSLIPLPDLFGEWPSGGERARLAYAESLSLVMYLRKNGQLTPLLEKLADGYSVVDALTATTGVGLGRFEQMWKRDLGRRESWLMGLNQGALWFFLALLLVVGALVDRVRRRRKYERLDDDLGPDYRH